MNPAEKTTGFSTPQGATMDPELYVFPQISFASLKVAASTALFVLVLLVSWLLLPLLPGLPLWAAVDRSLVVGSYSFSLFKLLHLLLGYGLFIYASVCAWRAAREKATVEDPKIGLASRILNTGSYARVRHPMYAMFILANTGLGFSLASIYGLAFALLSLVLFLANGLFEERAVMLRFFEKEYRAYMRQVPARFFTPGQAVVLVIFLALQFAGVYFS